MSTLVELVKRNFELANKISELNKENARLIEVVKIITNQDRTKGYPTGGEWKALVILANKALEKSE